MQLISLILLTVGSALAAQQYIDGEYFIALKSETDAEAFKQLIKRDYNIDVLKQWHFSSIILHVKGEKADVVVASKLSGVVYWEHNQIAYTQQCSAATNVWGLDRIDQQSVNGNNIYNSGSNDGAGVNAYIVDTGIYTNHDDFEGRATRGYTANGLLPDDNNGHGTHCAGTVGSTTYGVAKSVNLIAVKVMNALGSGSFDDIIDGLNYVTDAHNAGEKSVINLSLGGGASLTLDNAVQACIDDGVSVIIAAGNSDADGCNVSPGRVVDAVTVGATDISDNSATFTNYGTCLDVFAPGVNIESTWNDGGTNTIDGTSMACPHVVGAVARYMSSLGGAPSPAACHNWVEAEATPGAINFRAGHGTSPNLLLYVGGLC